MNVSNKEVSVFNYLNFLVDIEMHSKGVGVESFQPLLENVQVKSNSTPPIKSYFEFVNMGNIMGLAYTSLVVPKELFTNKDIANEFFKSLEPKLSSWFVIENGDADTENFEFLRLLRNAISHANYELNLERNTLLLWNETRQGQVNFKVSCEISKFVNLCLEIGSFMSNLRIQDD